MSDDRFAQWRAWSEKILSMQGARARDFILRDVRGESTEKGRGMLCVSSPFRSEKTPSFYIYPDGSWFDYGPQIGGDLVAYIRERDRCTFAEALDKIAEFIGEETWTKNKAGRGAPAQDPKELLEQWTKAEGHARVFQNTTRLVHVMHDCLPERFRDYVRSHYSLTDDTIDLEKVGYCPPGLYDAARDELGLSDEEMLETGMFVKTATGIVPHCAGRIMFGYFKNGLAVYTIGREHHEGATDVTVPDYDRGKYKKQLVHSARHAYVHPAVSNEHFWNEDAFPLARGGQLCITEGITDALLLKQIGFFVVSPVTTQFSDVQGQRLVALARGVREIIILNDNDVLADGTRPGLKGALKMAGILWAAGYNVRIVVLPKPDGVAKIDVNELVGQWLREGTEEDAHEKMSALITASPLYPDFLVSEIPPDATPTQAEEWIERLGGACVRLSPLGQQETLSRLLKRLPKLPKAAVRQTFSAALARAQNAAKKVEQEAAEAAAPKKSLGDRRMRGYVHFTGDGMDRELADGSRERISTFDVALVGTVAQAHGPALLVLRVLGANMNPIVERWVVPAKAWESKRAFIASFPHVEMCWFGSDEEVQGIAAALTFGGTAHVPRLERVSTIGLHTTAHGPRWVVPAGVIAPDGWMTVPDLALEPTRSTVHHALPAKPSTLEDRTRTLTRRLLAEAPRTQEPQSCAVALAWFTAALFCPIIRELHGSFPSLNVFGEGGSGKTSFITRLLWPAFGGLANTEPFSATSTSYAMLRDFCGANAIPAVFDEYKPVDMGARCENFRRCIRRVYTGETEPRGQADQTIKVYSLIAPTAVLGEARLDGDPALVERQLYAPFSKNWLEANSDARHVFAALTEEPLREVAPLLWQWSLGVDARQLLARAQADVDEIVGALAQKPTQRVQANLVVLVFGIAAYKAACAQFDAQAPRWITSDVVRDAIGAIYQDGADVDGRVRDQLAEFLHDATIMAHLGLLEEETHYVWTNQRVHLYVDGIEPSRSRWRREGGMVGISPGANALKRIAKENMRRGGYVVQVDHQTRMGDGKRPRCIVIDQARVPASYEIDFPLIKPRAWGAPERFGGTTPSKPDN